MMFYALDSNIISYWIGNNKTIINKVKDVTRQGCQIVIPEIVYYEVRRGLLLTFSPIKTATFNDFCNLFDVGTSNKETAEIAASVYSKLKKKGKLIEDADLLIAAFCLQNDYTLVTNNVKHFTNVENLKIENWV